MKKVLTLIMACFSFISISQTCPISFSPTVNYSVSPSPNGITSDDFNADGNIDLAFTQFSTLSTVCIMLGSASGTFVASGSFTAGNGSNDLVSADLNGDGKKDLIVANSISNDISVLLGNGAGSFSPAINFTTASGPRHLACVDFNNDANLDIVAGAANVASVTVLMGDGTGSFSTTATFGVGSTPQGVIAADFNGDNNIDIVSANQGSNNISLLLGTGAGNFATAVNFPVSGNPRKASYGDFNNDGNMDVAVSHFQFPQVSVLLGTGTGSFTPFTTYVSAIGSICYGITSADFNNDGSTDIAVPNNAVSTAAVLLGSPTGTFATGVSFSVQNVPLGITPNDFNNDGKIDLAVTNTGGSSVSVLLNSMALPTISAVSGTSLLCSGQSATLTANGAATYTWNGGSTNASLVITPTVTTTYTVIGTGANACTNISTFTQSVSACAGLFTYPDSNLSLTVFPNPFRNQFTIISGEVNNTIELEIYSMTGQKILSLKIVEKETKIDLHKEAPGIYFIRMGPFAKKILKE
jgi:hypothetical protein